MTSKDIKICLLGYSGHGLVVAEAAILAKMNLSSYADRLEADFNPFNLEYWGNEAFNSFQGWRHGVSFILGIGDNKTRCKVADFIRSKGYNCQHIIHPDSCVSPYSELGSGTFVARNAVINPFCKIGKDVVINSSASVDHECIIGSGSHLAPGAVLAGNVSLGRNVFIGANAVIKQGVQIGDDAVIGAGAVILHNVAKDKVVFGNPGKEKNFEI